MAGVPLLNGFLSKEMFFAETVFISSLPWVEFGLPIAATLAGVFASSTRCASASTSSSARCRPTCRASRTSRRTGCACRSSCWCWPAWSSASPRRWSVGPVLAAAARPVVGGALPAYSLAVWHGFNRRSLMSLIALAGGVAALPAAAHASSSAARFERTPLIGRLDGQRAVRERARAASTPAARRRATAARHAAPAAAAVRARRCVGVLAGAAVAAAARRLALGRPAARAGLARVRAAVADRHGLRASAPRGRPSSTGSPR